MKILYLILSFYVIMLAAKPCCADDCRAAAGSKKELAGNVPQREKECPGCSPFFTCGSCVGFIISQPLSVQLPIVAVDPTGYGAVYQQPDLEEIALSIWQPPKLS
ncbi:DUF6660 family protein [Mucilaginibacter sp. UYCu711]|uniref:DUF6660 family protein n=1 Tax=Mucilaginibacter sp. UYCu711 TaxID=3156339 RepID=UPI003D23BF11